MVNYSFRYRYLFFISGFFLKPYSNMLLSLVFMSSGSVCYLQTSQNHQIFKVFHLKKHLIRISKLMQKLSFLNNQIQLTQLPFMFTQLKKNQPISLLELAPGKGVQYVKSLGSMGVINKMDSRVGTALVKLPSGVKKIFSIYSLASNGQVPLSISKNIKITSAGFFKKNGKKSLTRGVAKNHVDHPHGGRNKAIRYQRTP